MVMYCHINEVIAMEIHNLYYGSYLSNCYVLISESDDKARHAAVVDPSTPAEKIMEFICSHNAVLDMIIITHGHFDHILSLDELRDRSAAPAIIHENDAEMLGDGRKNANYFFFKQDFIQRDAERIVKHGDKLMLGNEVLEVIHLPGHSKGSMALLGNGFMITGDTLFAEGFGRYDLYGGDAVALRKSLESLKSYDNNIKIYAGHGESARLGQALRSISYFLN
jgi:glyoxylase-like metal-dependent hydrolase (beta-lactamase superfamily II)